MPGTGQTQWHTGGTIDLGTELVPNNFSFLVRPFFDVQHKRGMGTCLLQSAAPLVMERREDSAPLLIPPPPRL